MRQELEAICSELVRFNVSVSCIKGTVKLLKTFSIIGIIVNVLTAYSVCDTATAKEAAFLGFMAALFIVCAKELNSQVKLLSELEDRIDRDIKKIGDIQNELSVKCYE